MQGIISSVGKQIPYRNFDVTITAQTSGSSNWTKAAAIGDKAYETTIATADIGAGVYIDANTHFDIMPRKRQGAAELTESDLDIYDLINMCESTATGIRFICTTGQPSVDIPITIRIYKQ